MEKSKEVYFANVEIEKARQEMEKTNQIKSSFDELVQTVKEHREEEII